MQKTLHPANTRGYADHGWLKSNHTFSFAGYHDPERMQFGALRVLNDDRVAAGMGFGMHGHADMEIISIPLSGSLAHKDSTGRSETILSGDVQIMSAGTGIMHSEFNPDKANEVNFLQIWILPEKRGIEPRYGQRSFDLEAKRNRFVKVVSWQEGSEALWINQRGEFLQGVFDPGAKVQLKPSVPGAGIYLFVIKGSVEVAGETLQNRDAIGITDTDTIDISVNEDSRLLAIEVPML